MTERLYYRDAFLREFDAQAIFVEPADKHWHVLLDRTAFYPTSGGQPNDTGRLGDAAVVDVFEREDAALVHVTDRPVARGAAHCAIDWDRRFGHMQQHTGQHLLSAAFIETFQFPTVSFHLGGEVSTIDLGAPAVEARHLDDVERRANQIIFEDRPVNVHFGTADELAKAGIRKEVSRRGILRAIEIEGFDRQPCGGTHVARTGQVGLILLRKCEKVKQNWRVEFVCGERARRAARSDVTTLGEAARLLSCGLGDVPAMLARALDERQAGYRVRQRLLEQLVELQAEVLAAEFGARGAAAPRVAVRIFEEADAEHLRLLAGRLIAQADTQVLFATRAGGHVVFAQSAGLAADMNALLRESLQAAGGKGGGTRNFAQGRLSDPAALDGVLERARRRLIDRATR